MMSDQQMEQGTATTYTAERGILMFKDHIAAMKKGSWRLGGDKQSGESEDEQDLQQSS